MASRGKRAQIITKDHMRGIQLNKSGLNDFSSYAAQYPDIEVLYLRENLFFNFDPVIPLSNLKVLDLSQNHLTSAAEFLPLLPQLRHLYLTGNQIGSLEGFVDLDELETLCISNNNIQSFEGLGLLPNLRILSANNNFITDLRQFPYLPSLYNFNISGNPFCESPNFRQLALAVCNTNLGKLNNENVSEEELIAVQPLRGKVAFCVTDGFLADDTSPLLLQAHAFLLNKQRASGNFSLFLHDIRLEGVSETLREGMPITVRMCLQDRRHLNERKQKKFYSKYIYPVEFAVQGEARQVLLVGSMNAWGPPIELEKCPDGETTFFHTTLYLPTGEYEYRYIVDGEEKVSEHMKATSKFNQGICNIYKVAGIVEDSDPNPPTLLHIRWLRSNNNNGFDLIEQHNTLTYTPVTEDVGCCLRVEVLSYLDGNFESLVFDITAPILCGQPVCTALDFDGAPMENHVLRLVYSYSGGIEGASEIQWSRITPAGDHTVLQQQDPLIYVPSLSDIGCKIKVQFTPIRDDGVVGDPRIAISPIILADHPRCKSILVVGAAVEGEILRLQVVYSGGTEGNSKYKWYVQEADGLVPIAGATAPEYIPTLADVGKNLVAEYTPVSSEGIEGEPATSSGAVIKAALPRVRSLRLEGECQEAKPISVVVDYFGGRPGAHTTQWYRLEDREGTTNSIPVPSHDPMVYVSRPEDIGHTIGVQVTPVREDGKQGEPASVETSRVIIAGEPQLFELRFACSNGLVEGNTLRLHAQYSGGLEGASVISWYRTAEEEDDWEEIPSEGDGKTHLLTIADIFRRLRVEYTPIRADGLAGPACSVETEVVQPGAPRALNVDLTTNGLSYKGMFAYFGGRPGEHHHQWSRVRDDGSETVICVTRGEISEYSPLPEDAGCRLRYGVKPVREDGEEGGWTFSSVLSAVIRSHVSRPPPAESVRNGTKPISTGSSSEIRPADSKEGPQAVPTAPSRTASQAEGPKAADSRTKPAVRPAPPPTRRNQPTPSSQPSVFPSPLGPYQAPTYTSPQYAAPTFQAFPAQQGPQPQPQSKQAPAASAKQPPQQQQGPQQFGYPTYPPPQWNQQQQQAGSPAYQNPYGFASYNASSSPAWQSGAYPQSQGPYGMSWF
eukprot:TRINITY_DN1569_c0_g1_i2.p1 TRINITY_DN1569_c0_g1~~TRINITY_DN1569_c0_g1_i2.p1  ORF type:complete len:1122 (+),score=126.98 TRINITY_DN1569_c0_g1_i2:29-3394(+)